MPFDPGVGTQRQIRSNPIAIDFQTFISSLFAGLIIALSATVTGIGVAALAFPGPLQQHIFTAVGVVLFGAAVMLVVTSALGSYRGTISLPQEAPAAILGLLAIALAGSLSRQLAPEEMVTAVIVAFAACTLITGLVFFLLGFFRLGGLIRFIPYPVVGGVLAGLGWLLVQGGLSVLTGRFLTIADMPHFMTGDALLRVGSGAAVAALLIIVTRKIRHFITLPALLAASTAVFFALIYAAGADADWASEHGWLLGPFPEGPAWAPISLQAMQGLDWRLLAEQLPLIGTLALVSSISILLYASGIEVAVRHDMDLNHELKSCGIANVLAGLGGGVPGFHSMSDTILAKEMGAANRLTGIMAAVFILLCLFLGFSVLSYFPRPVLGGLLFFVGASLLHAWIVGAWSKLPRADYLIVIMILIASAWFGYLEAIGLGIIAGIILFVVNYSRMDVTKHILSGASFRSNMDRSQPHQRALERKGDAIHVLTLQGFLFFGTANKILEQIRSEFAKTRPTPLQFVLLDFRLVSGLDSSSLITFQKIEQILHEAGARLILTSLSAEAELLLRNSDLDIGVDGITRLFVDLDHGLEWCEDRVLLGSAPKIADAEADEGEIAELFRRLDADGYTEEVSIEAGSTFIRQGEPSDDVYFIREGQVTVRIEGAGEGRRLRSYGPGTIVGEIAMYMGSPRSASVVAIADTKLARLTRRNLERLQEDHPRLAAAFHEMLAKLLCERLANTNKLIEGMA